MNNKIQDEINRRTTEVPKTSEEYKRIMHLLTISIPALGHTLKDLTVRELSLQTIQFQKHSPNKLMLQSWVNANSMGDENRIDDVLVRGIDIPESMVFTVGSIDEELQPDKDYQFFLCKVAVGRSMVVPDRANVESQKVHTHDFDSAYIQNNCKSGLMPDEIYRHDYMIYDKHKILATHLVQFRIAPEEEAFVNLHQSCQSCGEPATLYCKNDQVYLCDNCDEEVHEGQNSQVLSKHVRVKIHEKPRNFGNCHDHPEREYQFFCMNCQHPICVYCKIDGSHSSGQKSKHGIVRIGQAYKNAKDDCKLMDPALQKKKKLITNQRQEIRKKLEKVGDNVNQVEQKIYNMLKEALVTLREEYTRKVNVLQSDLVELNRQEAEIIYSHKIMEKHSEVMGPIDFLNLWTGHTMFKSQLQKQMTKIHEIHTDIRLENKPHIVTDNTTRPFDLGQSQAEKLALSGGDPDAMLRSFGAAGASGRAAGASRVGGGFMIQSQMNASLANPLRTEHIGRNVGVTREQQHENEMIKQRMQEDVKGLLKIIDSRLKETDESNKNKHSLSAQALRSSCYGVFSKTYKMLEAARGATNLKSILRTAFVGSDILDSTSRVVLYCNLPIDETYCPKTNLIYPSHKEYPFSIKQLLVSFESVSNAKKNPCILVMKVGSQILGAYCNEGWAIQEKYRGNSACFLFNLTNNLRFNAVPGFSHYQETYEDASLATEGRGKEANKIYELRFGTTDMVIANDFKACSSEIGDHFVFGNEFYKNKIKHINLKKETFKPDLVEVWSLV